MTADPLSQALDPWGFESPFGAPSASGERTTAAGAPAVVGPIWAEAPWTEAPWTEVPWAGEGESAGGVAFPSGAVLARASGATGRDEEHWDPNGAGLPLLDTGPAVRTTRLSPNFTVGELASSGGRASEVARISPDLVRVLQAIRDRAGKAVRITSGYRSWARNKALYKGYGKKPTLSRHCSGQAADITVSGLSGAQIARLAIDAAGPELAIGIGTTFAHVDVRGAWALWSYGGVAAGTLRDVRAYRDARRRGAPPAPGAPGHVPPGPVPPPVPPSVPRVPGQTAGGRLEVARVPLLAAHRGAGPDLVLRWNGMRNPEAIDVVVHLHGYSPPAAGMRLPRDKEPISGLDFSDPAGREPGGRARPTLALLPRGRSAPSAERPDRFTFPALTPRGAIEELVREGLARFAAHTGISAPLGRLILTAHSGGGAPLLAILGHTDPDEVHVFDALYQSAGVLAAWMRQRIARELSAPSAVPPALRVLFIPGGPKSTAPASGILAKQVCTALSVPGGARLAPRFRVDSTRVGHNDIPRVFGWRLLADPAGDLPRTKRVSCGGLPAEGREAETEGDEMEYGAGLASEAWEADEVDLGEAWEADDAREAGEAWSSGEESEAEAFETEGPEGLDPAWEGYEPESFEPETESDEAESYEVESFEPESVDPEAESLGPDESEAFEVEAEEQEWLEAEAPEPEAEAFPSGAVLERGSGATGRGEEHWDPHGTGLPLLATGPSVRSVRLARNFTVGELVTSGGRAADVARISPDLVRLLQAIRDRAGKPVRIGSGYRSWARNKALYEARGKTPTLSRHCSGQAADITIRGLSGTDIAKLAIDAGGTRLGIGVGGTFAHVDVRGSWALWTYLGGSAGRQATRTVAEYRRQRLSAPAPTPAQPPSPSPSPTPGTTTPDRAAGIVRQTAFKACTGKTQPGARALADQWLRLTGRKGGTYNCRSIAGTGGRPSIHGEGRAIDIYARADDPAQRAQTEAYIAWLIAHAVELQVGYIIWNRRQWSWPRRSAGWRPYNGASPHTDHAHVELSWEGALTPSPLFGGGVPGL